MKERLALATIASCLAAAIVYPLLRLAQRLLFDEPDPALVLWSEHAAYFWRVWTAAYVGGMFGFAAWSAAQKNAARVARLFTPALVTAAVLLAVQALLVP